MAKLILLRHLKSQWNLENRWTGWTDVPLSKEGIESAPEIAKKIGDIKIDAVYTSPLQRNRETVRIMLEKLGKENCHIVNYGDEEFQLDKIHSSSIAPLFSEIIVVSSEKKEIIEKLCAKHKDEQVFFIDDQIKHFDELDLDKCPNLKTILYTGQKLELL